MYTVPCIVNYFELCYPARINESHEPPRWDVSRILRMVHARLSARHRVFEAVDIVVTAFVTNDGHSDHF